MGDKIEKKSRTLMYHAKELRKIFSSWLWATEGFLKWQGYEDYFKHKGRSCTGDEASMNTQR